MAELESPADPRHYVDALKSTLSALDGSARAALFGSTALWGLVGREPSTEEDLDLLVHPEDVDAAGHALADAGFELEDPPEGWLLKAWHGDRAGEEPRVLVDLIFSPTGLDPRDAISRARSVSVAGMRALAIAPTDLLVSKAMAHGPESADYQGTIEFARLLREDIDWADLGARVEGPYARGLLHLLRELDIAPADTIDALARQRGD